MPRNKSSGYFKIEQKFIKDAMESGVVVLKASENSPQDGFTIIDELKAKNEINFKIKKAVKKYAKGFTCCCRELHN